MDMDMYCTYLLTSSSYIRQDMMPGLRFSYADLELRESEFMRDICAFPHCKKHTLDIEQLQLQLLVKVQIDPRTRSLLAFSRLGTLQLPEINKTPLPSTCPNPTQLLTEVTFLRLHESSPQFNH